MKLKLTVFMPHKNRAILALKSVPVYRKYLDIAPFDYEIIICDDHSEESEIEMLSCLIGPTVKLCETKGEHSYNAVLSMNTIAEHATGNIFLLTSAETVPMNSMFIKRVQEIVPKKYIVGSCLALGPSGTSRFLTTTFERFNTVKWEEEQDAMWYQHSKHNNRQFNFFSLIHKNDWNDIGGFNKDMKDTYAYDDVDFLSRLKNSGTQIVSDDEIMSVHLHHYLNGDIIFKNEYKWM